MSGLDQSTRRTATPRELWLVTALTAVAFGMRVWQLQHAGLSQFDEGVYVFSGLGLVDPSQPHRLFPDQQKFSPPVYFSLVALSYLLGGISDRSAIFVNVVLGTLTVPALWCVARQWVGGPAAVAAAAMLAVAGNHVELSRVALTDVTFALVFLLALGAVRWALDATRTASSIAAGLVVGLAWNTKYHGWFALVLGAMVIAARWRVEGEPLAALRQRIKSWLIMSAVALLCYLPWTLFIQGQSGATAGWAAYFATMLRINWIGNLVIHAQRLWMLESPWSRASVGAALLLVALVRTARPRLSRRALFLAVLGAILGAAGTAVGLSIWVAWREWRSRPSTGVWLAIAVVVLWIVMAPLYQPYFRLLLPFSIATFILTGRAMEWLAVEDAGTHAAPRWAVPAVLAGSLAIAMAMPSRSSAWRSARGLAEAAETIDTLVPRGAPVAVIGEPPLAFYLHQRGHPSFDRTVLPDLDRATTPMYVVTGHYARRAPSLRDGLAERRVAIEPIGRIPVDPTDLRLFDDYSPGGAVAYRQHPDTMYDLVLFRFDPSKRHPAKAPLP